MVQFVNVRELKNHVSEVIRRAAKGDVVVTSRGKPKAVLHSVSEGDLEDYLLANSPRKGGTSFVREGSSTYGVHRRGGAKKAHPLPLVIERDEDGFYVIECPIFSGCYSQGKTLDEALRNIREVIGLCLEEKENQVRLREYRPVELSFHTLLYA